MPVDRRTIITQGSLMLLALSSPLLRIPHESGSKWIAGVAYDRRFPEVQQYVAREYAARAASSVAWIAPYDGDLTTVWRERLRPHWSNAGGPVAGISTERGLLCVAQLAREHHQRVVAFRAPPRSSTPLFHWIVANRGTSAEEIRC